MPAAITGRPATSPVPNIGVVVGQSASGTAHKTESGLYGTATAISAVEPTFITKNSLRAQSHNVLNQAEKPLHVELESARP